mmetsp:Transcript_54482/g.93887  ORF Transcript_54482/g.93887 Transcript_54482/m.93887 type:complete len:111 (-) Transcript_54482:111-443(-)
MQIRAPGCDTSGGGGGRVGVKSIKRKGSSGNTDLKEREEETQAPQGKDQVETRTSRKGKRKPRGPQRKGKRKPKHLKGREEETQVPQGKRTAKRSQAKGLMRKSDGTKGI